MLVVDDDEDTSDVVRSTLEDAGFEVVAVDSGAEALSYLAHVHHRCVVLLDLVMVDMNGWEVLAALRRAKSTQHDIILMSGLAQESVPRGLPLLRKPFDTRQLLHMVRSVASA